LPTFSLNQCKRKIVIQFESPDEIFPRQQKKITEELINDPKTEVQNVDLFADFAVLSLPKKNFQTQTVSMLHDSISYDWFTGFSKKVTYFFKQNKKITNIYLYVYFLYFLEQRIQ